ncbi:MAG: hypothetical protein OJJ54_13495 [Pseudonocardia sp.]|nr:hypothetical protein [Pseudonocardia sp.]
MPKYRLNIEPDKEHDLTEQEADSLRRLGFPVEKLGEAKKAPAKAGEKKEN